MSPAASRQLRNIVVHGDCVAVMRRMESASVDFILTDPPYLCLMRPTRAGYDALALR